jgi:hypothetical protein
MKITLLTCFFALFLILFPLNIQAQNDCIRDYQTGDPVPACCNDIISTDPTNNNAENNERPWMKNQFNWMTSPWNVYHLLPGGGYTTGSSYTDPYPLTNPFMTDFAYLSHLNYSNYSVTDRTVDKLDFYPADGWELLYKNNGFKANESDLLTQNDTRVGPLIILYNKYLSKIRVFAAFADIGANDKMITTLIMRRGQGLKASALFNHYGELSYPLDYPTSMSKVSSGSDATTAGQFFSTDFTVGYDPCVCHFKSELDIEFSIQNITTLSLGGRLIGTIVDIDDSGNSPLINNRRDFLTAVSRDGFDVNGGILTYTNIDNLISKYKQSNTDGVAQAALTLLGGVLKAGAKKGDEWLIGPTGLVLNDIPFVGNIKDHGLTLFAQAADLIIGGITPEKKSVPSIQFIEAEMALSGRITDEIKTGATSATIATPGSMHTENTSSPNFVPDKNYPSYNEALGLFALLKTPVVKVYHKNPDTEYTGFGERENLQFWIDPESIKYAFNPAAEIDVEKTRISVSLEVNELHRNTPTWSGDGIELNGTQFSFIRQDKNSSSREWYSTPLYPINYIGSVTHWMYNIVNLVTPNSTNRTYFFNDNWYHIKFTIQYVFKPNKYGKVNQTVQVLTYPVNPIPTSQPTVANGDNYPVMIEVNSPTTYSNDQTFYAWGKIVIKKNIKTTNGAKVRFIAPSIDIDPDVEIGEDITLEIGLPPVDAPIPPVSGADLKSYCTSNDYRARSFDTEQKGHTENIILGPNSKNTGPAASSVTARPNPTTGHTVLQYSIAEPGYARLTVSDALGQHIATLADNSDHPPGTFEVRFDSSELPSGIYYYTLRSGTFVQTKKLMIIK